MLAGPTRMNALSRRVQWLDRHHRLLAIVLAAIVTPLLVWWVSGVSSTDSPTTVFTVLVGVIVWWVSEIALAWLTALWETECAQLMRDRGLPRAIAIVRK